MRELVKNNIDDDSGLKFTMAGKTLSQEYDFSESEDSPMKPFKSVKTVANHTLHKCQTAQTRVSSSSDFEANSDIFIKPDHVLDSDLDQTDTHKYSINVHMRNGPSTNDGRGDASRAKPQNDSNNISNVKPGKLSVVYMCSRQLVDRCDQMLKIQNRV